MPVSISLVMPWEQTAAERSCGTMICRCLCNLRHELKDTVFFCLLDHHTGLSGQLNPQAKNPPTLTPDLSCNRFTVWQSKWNWAAGFDLVIRVVIKDIIASLLSFQQPDWQLHKCSRSLSLFSPLNPTGQGRWPTTLSLFKVSGQQRKLLGLSLIMSGLDLTMQSAMR